MQQNNRLGRDRHRCERWIACSLVLLLLAACASDYADPATIADSVDPQLIFAKLSQTPSIDQGAAQFAAAINVDPALIRVRIQPGECSVCRFESTPQLSKAEGLTLAEANKWVEEKDQVSFFVPNFSCTFRVESEQFIPQSCQRSPI